MELYPRGNQTYYTYAAAFLTRVRKEHPLCEDNISPNRYSCYFRDRIWRRSFGTKVLKQARSDPALDLLPFWMNEIINAIGENKQLIIKSSNPKKKFNNESSSRNKNFKNDLDGRIVCAYCDSIHDGRLHFYFSKNLDPKNENYKGTRPVLPSRQPDKLKSFLPYHTNSNKGWLQTRTVQFADQHEASSIHDSRVPFQTRQVGIRLTSTHAVVQTSPPVLQV